MKIISQIFQYSSITNSKITMTRMSICDGDDPHWWEFFFLNCHNHVVYKYSNILKEQKSSFICYVCEYVTYGKYFVNLRQRQQNNWFGTEIITTLLDLLQIIISGSDFVLLLRCLTCTTHSEVFFEQSFSLLRNQNLSRVNNIYEKKY